MDEQYIDGRITVHFGADIVSLAHEVHGRVSYMDLVEGDRIEVKDDDHYRAITVTDVLETLVEHDTSKKYKGQSFYEGTQVRVKLDTEGNKQAVLTEKSG